MSAMSEAPGADHKLETAEDEDYTFRPFIPPVPKEKVNHPAHYNKGPMEVIDLIEGFDLGFHLGNVVKYMLRHRYKDNPIEDLRKARWYLDRYIQLLEKSDVEHTGK